MFQQRSGLLTRMKRWLDRLDEPRSLPMTAAGSTLDAEDADRARHQLVMTRRTLRVVLMIVLLTTVLSLLSPGNDPVWVLATYTPTVGALVFGGWLIRRGRWRATAWLLATWIYLLVSYAVVFFGGLMGNTSVAYIIAVMLAGALLGVRAAAFFVALCVTSLTAFLYCELEGLFPAPLSPVSPINAWVAIVVSLVLAAILHRLSVSSLDASLKTTASAVHHLRATQRDNHQRARFGTALANLAQRALSAPDATTFATEARELLVNALGAVDVLVLEAQDDGALRPLGPPSPGPDRLPLRLSPDLVEALLVLETGPLVTVAARADDPTDPIRRLALDLGHPSSTTVLGIAIRGRTRVLGVLLVVLEQSDAVPRTAEQFLETAAGLIGSAFERDLAQTRAEHAQKMELVGRFASGVAHDFNNLLMAMRGISSELRTRHRDQPETLSALDEFDAACEHASLLTRQLVTFARRSNPELEPLDLGRVVGEFLPMVGRLVGDDIQLHYESPCQPCPIVADRSNIEQLVMNLVVNARDAMPDGGTITVEVFATDNGGAGLRVSDSGRGMDEATLTRIFEPFFTTRLGGTGLGLATVRDIVTRHLANIEVESKPGVGSTFLVTFPQRPDAPPPTPSMKRVQVKSVPKLRVLLADDHALVRATTRRMLQRLGHEVVAVDDGRQALQRLTSGECFDLLVTDEAMPGLTGTDLLAELNSLGFALPTVIVSGHSEPDADAPALGPLRFLSKPFSDSALAEAVQAVLSAPGLGQPTPAREPVPTAPASC